MRCSILLSSEPEPALIETGIKSDFDPDGSEFEIGTLEKMDCGNPTVAWSGTAAWA